MKPCKFVIEGNLENDTTFNGKGAEVSEIIICPKVINNQNLIPENIVIKDYNVKGSIRVSGSNNITIRNCTFEGKSKTILIYLDSESSYVTIENNIFNTKTTKPAIILNGSSYNIIQSNTFNFPYFGVICFTSNNNNYNVITNNKLNYNFGLFNNLWKRMFPTFSNKELGKENIIRDNG